MAVLEDQIAPALLKRQLRDDDIVCPAGRVVGDADCYCSLEQGIIPGRTQTLSMATYCMGVHTECPTWIAQKELEWEGKRKSLLDRPKIRKPTQQQRQERLREAQDRLYADTKEGRKLRHRLGLPVEL